MQVTTGNFEKDDNLNKLPDISLHTENNLQHNNDVFDKKEVTWKEKMKSHLDQVSHKTGIPSYVIIGVILVALILVLIGYFEDQITIIVAVVYPAYLSLKALQTPSHEDDTHWLTYWVVIAFFLLIESFFGFVLKLVPLYFFLKLTFLIWCFLPNTRGALLIYNKLIIKCFKKYEKKADELDLKMREKIEKGVEKGKDFADDNLENAKIVLNNIK